MSEIVKSSSFVKSLGKFLVSGTIISTVAMSIFGSTFAGICIDMDIKYNTSEKITEEKDRTVYFVSGNMFKLSYWSSLIFNASTFVFGFFYLKNLKN